VRYAILTTFALCGLAFSAAWADESIVTVNLDSGPAYIVSANYANDFLPQLRATIPGAPKITGVWTPTEIDVTVAHRTFRNLIQDAIKDPTLLFPDLAPNPDASATEKIETAAQLENERFELTLVAKNLDQYARQYVGIVVDDKKLIFCNYADAPNIKPAIDYIFIDKVFVGDGTVHFLQCRFDLEDKSCSNVSLIGSWQRKGN
jgi:hypothetical protein